MRSTRLKVLFVCARNRWRSPTAEHLYRQDSRVEVRSAGIRSAAQRQVSATDLDWADVVFVMEREQKQWIGERFRDMDLPSVISLEIPDDYTYMDPHLIEALRQAIEPELAHLLANEGDAHERESG